MKRFYKSVGVEPVGGGYEVRLDGRPVRTPGKRAVAVSRREIAEAMAAEWSAQGDTILPTRMPMTRLVNSAIDGVEERQAEVAAEIVKYAASDLVCYRASEPEELVSLQAQHWDPLIAWARTELGAELATGRGIMHVAQSPLALDAVACAIAGLEALPLAGLHVMTTLTGSAVIAIATARGRLGAEAAWTAAHVDEDWQERRWGRDEQAAARRAARWLDMQAAYLAARVFA